jgi:flavin reductase (DIM6/NTAB) family NADH-FMN oxidoreductase RutF
MTTHDSSQELLGRFRQAFRRFPATVTVISYVDAADRPSGVTATAVTSLSVEPPSILISLNRQARSRDAIVRVGLFGVNVLALGQEPIATHCSRPGTEQVLSSTWLLAPAAARTPVLTGSLAHLDCTVAHVHEVHTHSVIVGRVASVWLGSAAMPLVYSEGAYRTLDPDIEQSYEILWERTFL